MKKLLSLAAVLAVAACAPRPPAGTPAYVGIVRQSEEVHDHLATARGDSKTVQAMHLDSLGLLDRLDHKAVILLQE
jgi:hypothetical protein